MNRDKPPPKKASDQAMLEAGELLLDSECELAMSPPELDMESRTAGRYSRRKGGRARPVHRGPVTDFLEPIDAEFEPILSEPELSF